MEIVNRHSRYDSLLRGEFGGTDVRLVFTELSTQGVSPESNNDGRLSIYFTGRRGKKKGDGEGTGTPRREISAHKAFLRSCGLVRAAFENDQFAEAANDEISISVPHGTFDAIDGLLRWCYDGRCKFHVEKRKTPVLVLDSYVTGIPALWALADFVQCQELCDEILAALRAGRLVRTGSSFARLVEEATALGSMDVLEAALEGLPLDQSRRAELENLLDWGSSEMLKALAKCFLQLEGGSKEDGDDGHANVIDTLGEYVAEMTKGDRADMPPSLFAGCLARLRTGTIPEGDYAAMILDYIEDINDDLAKLSADALLSSVDFSAISRENLVRALIPRVERVSPQCALIITDIAPNAALVDARCAFSAQILLDDGEDFACLPQCGSFLSSVVARPMFPHYRCDYDYQKVAATKVTYITCPVCNDGRVRNHTIRRDDVVDMEEEPSRYDTSFRPTGRGCSLEVANLRFVANTKKNRLRSYRSRKKIKCNALSQWALRCREEEAALVLQRPNKKARADNASLVLQNLGKFVRILNQCTRIGHATIESYCVRSSDTVEGMMIKVAERSQFSSSDQIRFFLNGESLDSSNTWSELGFDLDGTDELIIARRKQVGGKPVIRVYSTDVIDNMTVTLDLVDWSDVLTFPRAMAETEKSESAGDGCAKLTWNVRARGASADHSSIIEHKAAGSDWREYSYLFWEASTLSGFRICVPNASCVRSDELAGGILHDALKAQGLSTDEATEMATHWLPAMCKKEYVVVEFLEQHLLDKRAKLTVQPPPVLVHRVFMLFHPSDVDVSSECPLVRSPPLSIDRTRYAVVEWGGMEC